MCVRSIPVALSLFLIAFTGSTNEWGDHELTAEERLGWRLFLENRLGNPGANFTSSCRSCHLPPGASEGPRAFADFLALSLMPTNERGRKLTTKRNTPTLHDVAAAPYQNWAGEYESLEAIIRAKLVSQHYGWLPGEDDRALDEIWAIVLNDMGLDAVAEGPYLEQFEAVYGVDIERVDRADAIRHVVKALAAFVHSLSANRTSSYDAFMEANALPTAPREGEFAKAFAVRLREALIVREDRGAFEYPEGFNATALAGFKIFVGRGNCASCHPPPLFTDFAFHNTGTTQLTYDRIHGAGAFAALELPGDEARGSEQWTAPPESEKPYQADLGRWNQIENEAGFAAFKTPTLRNLGLTDPYMHDGGWATLEDAVRQKMFAGLLANRSALVHADPEMADVGLEEADVPSLIAFLTALNDK